MNKKKILAILNVISLALAVFVSYWANSLPLNGKTTGDISDQFDILFKPADYVFLIWGVIYPALLLFVVFPFLASQKNASIAEKTGIYFFSANVANALWILNWHYEKFLFTILLMAVILYSLIQIYRRLQVSLEVVAFLKKLCVHLPISLYLSWIVIAAIANLAIYLDFIHWDQLGLPDTVWFGFLLLAAIVLYLLVAITRRDIVFGTVFLWAFWGIAVQNNNIKTVSSISWIAVGAILLIYLYSLSKAVAKQLSTSQTGGG